MDNRFENFTILISKINRNIKKIKNLEMKEYNLRSIHVSCLYYLYVNSTLTASELCEKCAEDKASISRALDHLEKNNYVICDSKYQKRYNSPFSLTEKGNEVGNKLYDKVNVILNEANEYIEEDERILFYESLSKISNSLEKICNSKDL